MKKRIDFSGKHLTGFFDFSFGLQPVIHIIAVRKTAAFIHRVCHFTDKILVAIITAVAVKLNSRKAAVFGLDLEPTIDAILVFFDDDFFGFLDRKNRLGQFLGGGLSRIKYNSVNKAALLLQGQTHQRVFTGKLDIVSGFVVEADVNIPKHIVRRKLTTEPGPSITLYFFFHPILLKVCIIAIINVYQIGNAMQLSFDIVYHCINYPNQLKVYYEQICPLLTISDKINFYKYFRHKFTGNEASRVDF